MNDFKAKFMNFMMGRYGNDQLNKFIFGLILACIVLSILGLGIFLRIALILMIIYYFRAFSKNYNQRYAENQFYLKHSEKIRGFWFDLKKKHAYKKTHKIFKCKKCKKTLSVPKGKGKIEISCPCGNKFIKKT